jgi:hypothetical protein
MASAVATDPRIGPLGIQTNPELPSPAKVRWIDAVSRVCAHLNQVSVSARHKI